MKLIIVVVTIQRSKLEREPVSRWIGSQISIKMEIEIKVTEMGTGRR